MKTESNYIVIDTNVLISAGLLPQSRPAQVLALAVGHFVIAQNNTTWHELETRITKKKLDRYFVGNGRSTHLIKIAQSAKWFDIFSEVTVSRDPADDKFLGLALDSGAKIIISGDRDLTEIKTYEEIEILSPALFFERMQSGGF